MLALGGVLWPAVAPAEVPALSATVCMACHGEGGRSANPIFPSLAGQQEVYLLKQLKDYLDGKRQSDIMAAVLPQLRDADLGALVAYYARQKPPAPAADGDARAIAAGRAVFEDGNPASGVPACVGCHQTAAVGNERYPRLAGQHAAYGAAQLKAFRAGARSNDRAKVMRAVAERLSDAEIDVVSIYLASLP